MKNEAKCKQWLREAKEGNGVLLTIQQHEIFAEYLQKQFPPEILLNAFYYEVTNNGKVRLCA